MSILTMADGAKFNTDTGQVTPANGGSFNVYTPTPASTPAPISAPSSGSSGSSSVPSQITSDSTINSLYQKYFGRGARPEELTFWKTQPSTGLETELFGLYKNKAGLTVYDGSPIVEGQTKTTNQLADTNSDKIIYKQGNDLYIKEGNNYKKIPDQKTLENLVFQQGYKDTRPEVPAGATIGRINETPTGGTQTYDPFDEIAKYGYSREDFLNDPGFFDYWSKKTPEQLKTALATRKDWDATTNKRKGTVEAGPAYDPYDEAAKLGYTRDDFLNDPGFFDYWSKKTTEQLATALKARSDYDVATGKKKVVSPSSTNKAYGQDTTPQEISYGAQLLGSLLKYFKDKGLLSISDNSYNNLIKDPGLIKKYGEAIFYGKYSLDDIQRDMKIKELIDQGNTAYTGMKGIDDTMKAEDFYISPAGQKVKADTTLAPNSSLAGIDADLMGNSVFKVSGEAYQTLIKPIDWSTPEFKAEAEKIKASYFDILNQNYQAQTDQEKAVAKSNYDTLAKNIQEKYNITLGNNVKSAWGQLEQLFAGSNEAGTLGSGIVNEATDKYLADMRSGQDISRKENVDSKDIEKRNYLMKSGNLQEIKDYIYGANNQPGIGEAKAKKYGLIASDDAKNFYNVANLKAQYPDMSDKQIQDVVNMMIDPATGIYNSQLYKNLYSNKYDVNKAKETYQIGNVQTNTNGNITGGEGLLYKKAIEANNAMRPFTSQNPFSSYNDSGVGLNKSIIPPQGSNIPYTGSDSSKWSMNQSVQSSPTIVPTWTAPAGYEKVPNVASLNQYTDTIKNTTTGATDIWGKKKTTF